MRKILAVFVALALLAPPIAGQHSGPLNSNVASVRLTATVPERASMSASLNEEGTEAIVKIDYNLIHAPQRVGVEYNGQEYDVLCRNETFSELAAMDEVTITVALQPGGALTENTTIA